jgi:hypothetical protein
MDQLNRERLRWAVLIPYMVDLDRLVGFNHSTLPSLARGATAA